MEAVSHVSTECDNGIDVLIRTATLNPLLQTGHTIYLNRTKVTRLVPIAPLDYERERAAFRITSAGQIF